MDSALSIATLTSDVARAGYACLGETRNNGFCCAFSSFNCVFKNEGLSL